MAGKANSIQQNKYLIWHLQHFVIVSDIKDLISFFRKKLP